FLHRGAEAHLGYGLRSRRRTEPALDIDDLPPLDVCLLSHLYGDAWDPVADERLDHALPILTTPHAAPALRHPHFHAAHGIDPWTSFPLRRGPHWLRVTSLPARPGPPLVHHLLPPVMGSLLEWGRAAATPTSAISATTATPGPHTRDRAAAIPLFRM